MLERSKAADLIVVSKLPHSHSPESPALISFLKEVLTRHASRVRELELDLGQSNPSTLAALFEDPTQPSLRLNSLQLTCNRRDDYHPTCPTALMETGSLRRLEIEQCDDPWYSMSLLALTDLKLYDINDRPPLIQFLELLRGLSTLQVLDMEDSLPLAIDLNCGLIDPVHLPHLRHLCLSSTKNQKEVTNILSRIIIPPTTTLKFILKNHGSEENTINFDALASSFLAFFSPTSQSQGLWYRALHVLSEQDGHVHLQAWKDDHDGSVCLAPNLEVIVALNTHPTPIHPEKMVRKIFPSLPLTDITTLTLDINPVALLLKYTFGHLHHLKKVTVVGKCLVEFIEALGRKGRNHNTQLSVYHSVAFPALELLWIKSGLFEDGSCTVETLQDCLMERYERKAELLKLKLTDCCKLFHSDVENLREIVVDVEWDELETGYASEWVDGWDHVCDLQDIDGLDDWII
jgi:hypothetical protein